MSAKVTDGFELPAAPLLVESKPLAERYYVAVRTGALQEAWRTTIP
jgi:hypothetical protein